MSNTIKSIDLQALNEKITYIPSFGEKGSSTRSIIRDLNEKIAATNNQKGVDNLAEKQASAYYIVERATRMLRNTKKPEFKAILEDWLKQNPFLDKYREDKSSVASFGLFSNKSQVRTGDGPVLTFSHVPTKK